MWILLFETVFAATVSGNFDHPYGTEIRAKDVHGTVIATAPIAEDAFSIELALEGFSVVTFESDEGYVKRLFLEPDDAIEMASRIEDGWPKHTTLAGVGADRNDAWSEFAQRYAQNDGIDERYWVQVSGRPSSFLKAEKKVVAAQRAWLAERDLGEGLTDWMNTWITYKSQQRIVYYPMHHQIVTDEKVVPKGALRRALAALPVADDAHAAHLAYGRMLGALAAHWNRTHGGDELESLSYTWNRIEEVLERPTSRFRFAQVQTLAPAPRLQSARQYLCVCSFL